jgi:Ti-type conjugative transfer relaxase TraA
MASYHCEAKSIGRGQGRSVVAAAAYRAGETLVDARTGLTWDFTRKTGVLHSEIMTPLGAPAWAQERQSLWDEAERAEDKSTRRAAAKTGREFRLALAAELTHEERLATVRAFAAYLIETYGMAVDFSVHAPDRRGDQRNYHAHVLTTTRRLTDAGFGGKIRELDSPRTSGAHLAAIRERWAAITNRALEAGDHEARVDHRSFEARGLDQEATVHLGPAASALERRGEVSDLGDHNRAVQAANTERARVKAERDELGVRITGVEIEMERRRAERAERASVAAHDPAAILEAITAKRATFTEAELHRVLGKTINDPFARRDLAAAILARPEVVGLADRPGEGVSRYTTREVLAAEGRALAAADGLARDRAHGVSRPSLIGVMERAQFVTMKEEQRVALFAATGPAGLALIAGEAGTGKSYVMQAVRAAYEAEGARVVGLSFTNMVVQDMKRDGFKEVRTITGALKDVDAGRARWDRNTVLMVDEAAMLATSDMAALLTKAREAGAKVILVGDEQQLSSIAHGGLFAALRERHGASELAEVTRVANADERRAFNRMHAGDFREALGIFEGRGAIRWSDTQDQAKAALVSEWAKNTAQRPEAARFVFTYTNAEALELNAELRAIRRERGELGADHILPTKDGPAAFAAGDRIQFTGSAYRRADRDAGLANGMVGTVKAIEGLRLTVELDGKGPADRRTLSFNVGEDPRAGQFNAFRHGYAGTIYKGQGRTVDEAYALHSQHWRAASSYVAATRHRDTLRLFTARELAGDLDKLAAQMGRREERRAAVQFAQVERPVKARDAFSQAAQEAVRPPAAERADDAIPKTAEPARGTPSVQQMAQAQRKAAIIGRSTSSPRVAEALAQAHRRDATKRVKGQPAAESGPTPKDSPTSKPASPQAFKIAGQIATRPEPRQDVARPDDPHARVKAALAEVRRAAEQVRDEQGVERPTNSPERFRPRGRTR